MTLDPDFKCDVAARMDRLPVTALHLLAMSVCAFGMMLDTLEMSFGGVLAAVFSAPPAPVPAGQLSLLLAAVFFGAVIGAPLLGWWADRRGRRTALAGLLLWMAASSLGAATLHGIAALTLCRFLCGLALGGYPPLAIAYLTDLLPPRRRGTLIFSSLSLALVGPPAAIFLVRWLTPLHPLDLEGWRWGFLAGAAASAAGGLLFLLLPESPRWLQARGHTAHAQIACLRFERSRPLAHAQPDQAIRVPGAEARDHGDAAFAAGRRWTWVAALFSLSPWATVAFPLLTGAVLTQRGFKLDEALLIFGLSSFGPMLGTLAVSTIADRIDRRLAMASCTLVMLASGAFFIFGSGTGVLIAAMAMFNLAISLYVTLLTIYSAELFPTRARASRTAGGWALNRMGAALGSLLLVPVLRNAGPPAMFAVVAVSLVATLGLLAAAPHGRQQQAVS
jgi:MFS transporter, putative metabolite:H+ symporter